MRGAAVFWSASARLRRLIRGCCACTSFGTVVWIAAAFSPLPDSAALETIPLVIGATPHIRSCVLHPGPHWSCPVASEEIRGRHTCCHGQETTERAGIFITFIDIDVPHPALCLLPPFPHLFPLITRVPAQFGQSLLRPFASLTTHLLHVFQALPDPLAQGSQTFAKNL